MEKKSYCVIGHPIGHTMSPFIHKRLFDISGLSADYTAMDIAPESLDLTSNGLAGLDGFNVTIPHKQAVIPLIDRLDNSALTCGAVNVVSLGKESVGYNTDGDGFIGAIDRAGMRLGGRTLICGAGGAARAVALSAAAAGGSLTIAVRDGGQEKAKKLCEQIKGTFPKAQIEITTFEKIDGKYDLAVNATPVGMYPNVGKSVLSEEQIDRCDAIYDLVYNPEETEFIKIGRRLGKKCDSGMSMLVLQAAKAHEIWYGASFEKKQIDHIIADAKAELRRIF